MTNFAINLAFQKVICKFRGSKKIYSKGTANITINTINLDGLIFKICEIQQKGERRKTS